MAKKLFADMNEDERAVIVRVLMEKGHTNKTAAATLGTTPGTIAGIRHRKKIPPRPKKPQPKKKEKQLRRPRLKKIEKPMIAPKLSVPPLPEPPDKPLPPYKLASMRHLACDDRWEDGTLCEYVHEEGSRYCVLHNWMHKHPCT